MKNPEVRFQGTPTCGGNNSVFLMKKYLHMALSSAMSVDSTSMITWLNEAKGHATNAMNDDAKNMKNAMSIFNDQSRHIRIVFHQQAMEMCLVKALQSARRGDKVSTTFYLNQGEKCASIIAPKSISVYHERTSKIQDELRDTLHQQKSESLMNEYLSMALDSAKEGDKISMIQHLFCAEQYAEDAKAIGICEHRGNEILTMLVDRKELDMMEKYLTKAKNEATLGSGHSMNFWLVQAEKHANNANALPTYNERARSLRNDLFDKYCHHALHFSRQGEEVYMNVYLDQIEKYCMPNTSTENRDFIAERISSIRSTCKDVQQKERNT